MAAIDQSSFLTRQCVLDGEGLAASVASSLQVDQSPALAEPKGILELLRQKFGAIELARDHR